MKIRDKKASRPLRGTRRSAASSFIDGVEAAYDLDDAGGDDRWAISVMASFRPAFDRGMGVGVYMTTPEQPFRPVGGMDLPTRWEDALKALMRSRDGHWLVNPPGPCKSLSDMIGRPALAANEAMQTEWAALGVKDLLGLIASDGTESLLTFFAPLADIESLSPQVSHRLAQLASHIVAAWRLRRALAREPVAVLSPDGKVLPATGRAEPRSARDRLRDTARAIDRARGPLRRADEDEALSLWKVLVDGQWSLVDRFDSDGRRYLVARENEPDLKDPRALSLRERQVLAFTALGHAQKLIAYELGISPSAVSALRTRAMRKLRLQTRLDVVRLFRSEVPGVKAPG